MCGIAGWFSTTGDIDRAVVTAMGDALAHRGPDGGGTWFSDDNRLGLAHRRLAILDPEPRSDQPFEEAGHVLVFNGEIYNHRDLRKRLPGPWRTEGDTETLLRLLRTMPTPEALGLIEGMYAFAWWDGGRRALTLARDPFGQKPLFVADVAGGVAFASELAALRRVPGLDLGVSRAALIEYLRWGYVPEPKTIHRHVEKLPHGAWRRYASAGGRDHDVPAACDVAAAFDGDTSADAVRRHVLAATDRQLISDVPIGVLLSGGIDSSVVAAAAVAARRGPVRTFCVGFDDSRYDERPFARRVAEHLGTDHADATVSPDVAEDLPKLVRHYGEPFADSSALPTFHLSKFVSRHVKVALGGDGGDELFGGYERYWAFAQSGLFWPLGSPMRLLAGLLPAGHPKGKVAKFRRFARAMHFQPELRYLSLVRLFDADQLRQLTGDAEKPTPHEALLGRLLRQQGHWPIAAAAALDRQTYLVDDLHAKVDRASMACSLEVRSPFMDRRLMTLAGRLRDDHLMLGRRHGKRRLREAFAGDLPSEVFDRRKMGFALPIGDWFRGPLRGMLREHVLDPGGFCAAHLDAVAVRRLIDEHDAGRDHGQRLYALLFLEVWAREFGAT
jgi:asparagine synthase (glutamine-hydrolysing)